MVEDTTTESSSTPVTAPAVSLPLVTQSISKETNPEISTIEFMVNYAIMATQVDT